MIRHLPAYDTETRNIHELHRRVADSQLQYDKYVLRNKMFIIYRKIAAGRCVCIFYCVCARYTDGYYWENPESG